MRSLVEWIVDFIVFRVLLFQKMKSKVDVRRDLQSKILVSSHPGVYYDGIYALVLNAIHFSKVFIGDENVIHELITTIVKNIISTSVKT